MAYTGHANLHTEHEEENWYFNRTRLSLVRRLGENGLHLTSELRHYTVPDKDDFDFARHTGILSYKRMLSKQWELNFGYQNIITRYPQTSSLDYDVNGAFVQVYRHIASISRRTTPTICNSTKARPIRRSSAISPLPRADLGTPCAPGSTGSSRPVVH